MPPIMPPRDQDRMACEAALKAYDEKGCDKNCTDECKSIESDLSMCKSFARSLGSHVGNDVITPQRCLPRVRSRAITRALVESNSSLSLSVVGGLLFVPCVCGPPFESRPLPDTRVGPHDSSPTRHRTAARRRACSGSCVWGRDGRASPGSAESPARGWRERSRRSGAACGGGRGRGRLVCRLPR